MGQTLPDGRTGSGRGAAHYDAADRAEFPSTMKLLFRLLLWTTLAALLAVTAALALALQSTPRVVQPFEISVADIARARGLLAQHDLRRLGPGRLRTLVLSQDDVDALLNHAAHRYANASARAVITPQHARAEASLPLQLGATEWWLNLRVELADGTGLPVVEHLQIGRLPLPTALAPWLLARAVERLNVADETRLAVDMVRQISFWPAQLRIDYEWRPDSAARLLTALVPQPDQQRLKAYSDRLVELAALHGGPSGEVSLLTLLGPMFELARQRSTGGGDAARENRAAILTLAFFVNRKGLAAIVPAARSWARPTRLRVTLDDRDDFPQHLLVSAAIAAEAGGPLADALGLYKEVDDSRVGSGFSFRDIAIDRAGTRLGELAVASPLELQARLAATTLQQHELIPDVADLPEFMPAAEFEQRYGGIGAPAYRQVMADIEARVAATPVLRR